MAKQILVVSAHPDDETIGVGGTIVNHIARGDQVSVLILTDGVTARHNETDLQQIAARKACRELGVENIHFANLPDQRLDELPLVQVVKPISQLVQELRPQVVYTHHRGDANQDHRAVFAATLVAVRPVNSCPVERVLCYEVASSTEWGPPFTDWAFLPNYYVNIDATLETKLRAVEAYRDTFQTEIKPYPHPRSPEALRLYAQQRGVTVGLCAAEAFVLIRELVVNQS